MRTFALSLAGVLLMAMSAIGFAQAPLVEKDTLTIEEAVALAMQYQPSIQSSEATLNTAQSASTIARSNYFPQVAATAGVTHTDGAFVFNPTIPPRNQSYDNYATGITATQTVLDFGKMVSRVRATGHFEEAAERQYDSTQQTVAMNVMIAYYAVMQARQTVKVDSEAVERANEHVRQAKAFYSVGTRAQVDVAKAEVDLSNANVDFIRAKNQYQISRLQLENAMGVRFKNPFVVTEQFAQEPFTMPLDSVMMAAMNGRPEVLAARARVEANSSLVTAAWSQNLPTVSVSGAYNWTNFNFPLLSRWNLGLTVSLPIFQGFALQAGVDQAKASEQTAEANLNTLLQSVQLDVEQQYLSVKAAEEEIASTQKLVEQAEISLTLAEKQYAAGVGGAIEVTDARLALSNARISQIQAFFDYNSSLVRLKRAMGALR